MCLNYIVRQCVRVKAVAVLFDYKCTLDSCGSDSSAAAASVSLTLTSRHYSSGPLCPKPGTNAYSRNRGDAAGIRMKTDNGDYNIYSGRKEQVPCTCSPARPCFCYYYDGHAALLCAVPSGGIDFPIYKTKITKKKEDEKKFDNFVVFKCIFVAKRIGKRRRTSTLEENRSCILYEPISPGYIVCRAGMNPSFPIGCIVPRMQGRNSKKRRRKGATAETLVSSFFFLPFFCICRIEEEGKRRSELVHRSRSLTILYKLLTMCVLLRYSFSLPLFYFILFYFIHTCVCLCVCSFDLFFPFHLDDALSFPEKTSR
jgi:hypothetical protein